MALSGVKVVEFAGLAPGPFAGLVLADNGADVVRVDRIAQSSTDILCRKKRSISVNSKVPSGRELLKRLISSADVLIDPFRPGVMEKLGLGPNVFLGKHGINKRLIYARLSGFPRTGTHKDMAGHDINYLALSGVLSMLPGADKPVFPLNLLADFAGGGLACALGILLALLERGKTGLGQVVNTDMVSGARYVSTFPLLLSLLPNSHFGFGPRGNNLLDGGAPFYDVYTCQDGRWMSVGCLEPQFFKSFIDTLLLALPEDFAFEDGWRPTTQSQLNRAEWPKMKDFFTRAFLCHPRDFWALKFHGTDGCAVPVLDVHEASDAAGSVVPPPHPQVSNVTISACDGGLEMLAPGNDTESVLAEIGIPNNLLQELISSGAIGSLSARSKL